MKKIAFLLAILLALSGCGAPAAEPSSAPKPSNAPEASSSELSASEIAASEAAEKAAASEAAAKTASEAAAAEAAAKAASEAAAAEAAAKAASEAAAAEAAAKEAKSQNKAVTGSNFYSKVESAIIKKINKERVDNGLEELEYNEDLRSAARIRSRELCKARKFSHTRPNGDDWSTVIKEDVPIDFITAGENLCTTEYNDPSANYATSASFWFNEWKDSPPHYENILREDFTHIGVGVYIVEKDGWTRAYATTEFAHLPN
ncbi:CAP domain-containing protein [Anaerotruncus rubiinfantis]|uniref:CAP domain-containing protein n=1 Tax=Anaerotruncus rubiinfantis TaxID=1720200 RepID=UPI00083532A1|nr:CAP domain-containing protein [Anaerotruncus rubiinfantis]